MFRITRALRLTAGALVVAGGLIVASCSGGTVQTTPLSSATSAPVTQSIPAAGGTLTLASSATNVAQVTFGAGAPAGLTLTANSSATAPAGAPAVTSLKRAAESAVVGGVPFFYVTFSVSTTFSSALLAGESVTLTGQPTTASFGVEFADITSTPATALGDAGPGTLVNNVVTIANGTSTNSPSLVPGHTYLIMFFYVPAGTVQPSPSPSASASPAPSPSASASAGPGFTFTGGSDNTGAAANCNATACEPLAPAAPPFNTTITFGVASAPVELFVAMASGAHPSTQISPSATFTYFTGTGTVEEYLQLSGSTSVTFAQTPSVTVHGLTNVTGCAFYIFTTNSIWAPVSPATGAATVTAGSVTMPMAAGVGGNGQVNGNPVNIGQTPAYGAVVCN